MLSFKNAELPFIDNNHYRLTDKQAGEIAKANNTSLPKWGYEKLVTIDNGETGWLRRTPYRLRPDSPERGWVWSFHHRYQPTTV